jgi:hypothetical protein
LRDTAVQVLRPLLKLDDALHHVGDRLVAGSDTKPLGALVRGFGDGVDVPRGIGRSVLEALEHAERDADPAGERRLLQAGGPSCLPNSLPLLDTRGARIDDGGLS